MASTNEKGQSKVIFVGNRNKNIGRELKSGAGAVQFEREGDNWVTSMAQGIIGFSEKFIRFAKRKRVKTRSNHHKNRPTV